MFCGKLEKPMRKFKPVQGFAVFVKHLFHHAKPSSLIARELPGSCNEGGDKAPSLGVFDKDESCVCYGVPFLSVSVTLIHQALAKNRPSPDRFNGRVSVDAFLCKVLGDFHDHRLAEFCISGGFGSFYDFDSTGVMPSTFAWLFKLSMPLTRGWLAMVKGTPFVSALSMKSFAMEVQEVFK